MFFINLTLRDFAGDQTLDESHIVDVFGMGWEAGFRMAVIPFGLIVIWVDDQKGTLIRQLGWVGWRRSVHFNEVEAKSHNDQRSHCKPKNPPCPARIAAISKKFLLNPSMARNENPVATAISIPRVRSEAPIAAKRT